jgi:hypothetical protein
MIHPRKNPLLWFDLLLVGISYIIVLALKSFSSSYFSEKYLIGLGVFVVVWFTVTAISRKFRPADPPSDSVSLYIIIVNLVIFGIIAILMYGARSLAYSRFIIFGTIGLTTFFEIITYNIYNLISEPNGNGERVLKRKKNLEISAEALRKQAIQDIRTRETSFSAAQLKNDIIEECGEKAYEFISSRIDLSDTRNLVISTTTRFNVLYQPENYLRSIINLRRTNDMRYINKFFEAVNLKLPNGGQYMGCAETKELRKQRILRKYPPLLNWIYYFMDFVIKRIFPKFRITRRLYFLLTRGENRVMTRAEILGRLYSCGFEIQEEGQVNGKYFFLVNKIKEPAYNDDASYSLIIRLPRIGKDGKMIRVYKMRTMHAYAEYLQYYIYNTHNLKEGGKFNNDFRISMAGRVIRTLWLDELPMLINWFRGEVKLVGVRPLTEHYFKLYSKEHQERRITYKPGLVPPYYADLPKTIEEIEESERRFLNAYDKHPFRTNWRYFWRAFYNIVFKHARSR